VDWLYVGVFLTMLIEHVADGPLINELPTHKEVVDAEWSDDV